MTEQKCKLCFPQNDHSERCKRERHTHTKKKRERDRERHKKTDRQVNRERESESLGNNLLCLRIIMLT